MPKGNGAATGHRVGISRYVVRTVIGWEEWRLHRPDSRDERARTPNALSIILPSGNGNATQINILEGNIFRAAVRSGRERLEHEPQLGPSAASSSAGQQRNRDVRRELVRADRARRRHRQRQRDADQHRCRTTSSTRRRASSAATPATTRRSAMSRSATATGSRPRAQTRAGLGTLRRRARERQHDSAGVVLGQHLQPAVQPVRLATRSQNTAMTNVSGLNGNGSPTSTSSAGHLRGGRSTRSPATAIRLRSAVARREHRQPAVQPSRQQQEQQPGSDESVVLQRQFQPDGHRGGRPRSVHGRLDRQRQFESVRQAGLQHLQPAGHVRRRQPGRERSGFQQRRTGNGNYSPNDVTSPGGGPPLLRGQQHDPRTTRQRQRESVRQWQRHHHQRSVPVVHRADPAAAASAHGGNPAGSGRPRRHRRTAAAAGVPIHQRRPRCERGAGPGTGTGSGTGYGPLLDATDASRPRRGTAPAWARRPACCRCGEQRLEHRQGCSGPEQAKSLDHTTDNTPTG